MGRAYPLIFIATALTLTISKDLAASSQVTAGSDDNAATVYRRASSQLVVPAGSLPAAAVEVLEKGWQGEHPELEKLLAENKTAIEEFQRATTIANCRFPIEESTKPKFLGKPPVLINELQCAKLVLLEGVFLEKEGKLDQARGNYLAVMRFANHLGRQQDFILLGKLMEMIVRKMTSNLLQRYAHNDHISIDQLQAVLSDLIALRQQQTTLEDALREEHEGGKAFVRWAMGKSSDQQEVPAEFRLPKGFNEEAYQEMVKWQDEFFNDLLLAFRNNRFEEHKQKVEQFSQQVKEETKSLNLTDEMFAGKAEFPDRVSPKLLGRVLVALGTPGYEKAATKYYTSLTQWDVLLAGIAIRAYQLVQGQLPTELGVLVPQYLPEVPEDPFNNFKPLQFQRNKEGWVVYSLGPDRTDNHGQSEYDEQEASKTGDIAFLWL